MTAPDSTRRAGLATVAREWTRIGLTGFGGPPAHIALLRRTVVERHRWLDAEEFEHANAAVGLLPGPASTQLAIFCGYRVAGAAGAIVGGLGFVAPAVVFVLALSAVFFGSSPPDWVRGAGAGAGAAVAAVALQAARDLAGPSWARARGRRQRWIAYALAGVASAALAGPYVVVALVACGLAELARERGVPGAASVFAPVPLAALAGGAGLGALVWVAFKVGALSYGGGFVIIPLMHDDAVDVYHWMTEAQFLNAVALGQVTPGPVVSTVAAVGYAAHGAAGALIAAAVAFAPSFTFVLVAGGRFERLRGNASARAFLEGAGPAAIGAIAGAAITLALALHHPWQGIVLAGAAVALLVLGRGVVQMLLVAGAVGVVVTVLEL